MPPGGVNFREWRRASQQGVGDVANVAQTRVNSGLAFVQETLPCGQRMVAAAKWVKFQVKSQRPSTNSQELTSGYIFPMQNLWSQNQELTLGYMHFYVSHS